MIVQQDQINWSAEAMAIDIEAAARAAVPGGEVRSDGRYYVLNPRRNDHEIGSFSISIRTGQWSDFAVIEGIASGHDVISFWAYARNVNNVVALRQIHDALSGQPARVPSGEPVVNYTVVMPIPIGNKIPDRGHHPTLQYPDIIHTYTNINGEALCYVCRWEANGRRKKEIRPYCMVVISNGDLDLDKAQWRWLAPPTRPLYGLNRLVEAERLIIVEGEKKADIASTVSARRDVWISWMGGAKTVPIIDITPLRGWTKPIILWPDKSEVGIRAMANLAQRLVSELGITPQVMEFPPDEDLSDDWDVADAVESGWTRKDIEDFIELLTTSEPEPSKRIEGFHPIQRWPIEREKQKDVFVKVDCIENVRHMLREYGIQVRYNEMRREIDYKFPRSFRLTVKDHLMQSRLRREITNLRTKNSFPRDNYKDWIAGIAEENAYHPFIEWSDSRFDGEVYDGSDHIGVLVDLMTSPISREEVYAKFKRWLISLVAVTYRERKGPHGIDPVAHGVLTLVGPQGIGKTSIFSCLLPPSMSRLGAALNPENKDSVIQCTNRAIVEWGEADSMNRTSSNIAAIKAHVTMSSDMIRMPYAECALEYPRMTVYCASVNNQEFLSDDENRRWWCIPVTCIQYDRPLNIKQLWAQAVALYRAGEQWWLNQDEGYLNALTNVDHRKVDPIEERLFSHYDWRSTGQWTAKTSTDILLEMGYANPTAQQKAIVGRVLSKLADRGITTRTMSKGYPKYKVPKISQVIECVDSPNVPKLLP